MPTKPSRARKMLANGKAKVYKQTPFTIQLTKDTKEFKQPITLGVDAGSKIVGISATTDKKELFSSEVQLRNDIVDLLSARRALRTSRRNRKTRYRAPRFNNRVKSKHKGWLAPSVENKINTHIQVISNVNKILPITKIIIETAAFDIQKIQNPDIEGADYQKGDQLGFWNTREYVLWRDGHKCQGKKGCKNEILNVHHIESRKTGGNAPNNLITLCEKCHTDYHSGKLKLNLKRGQSFRDATFMGIMRWTLYNRLKEIYPNIKMTYGYITKNTRITNNLPKAHYIDARCITENPLAEPLGVCYIQRATRRHNRQLHKCTTLKGGRRKNNQTPRITHGFQLFDKVLFENKLYYVNSRRTDGIITIKAFGKDVIKINKVYKKLKLVEKRKTFLTYAAKQLNKVRHIQQLFYILF